MTLEPLTQTAGPPAALPTQAALSRGFIRFFVMTSLLLAGVSGLCFGLLLSGEWVRFAFFRTMAFLRWPRPRSLDWTEGLFLRQQPLDAHGRWIHYIAWAAGLAALALVVRSLSMDLPFVIPGQTGRRGPRAWMALWVNPRLVVRGLISSALTVWLLGLPHLYGGDLLANTETKRVLMGGLRLVAGNAFFSPYLTHGLVSVTIATVIFLLWSSDGLFSSRPFDIALAGRPLLQGISAGLALAVLSFPYTEEGRNQIREYLTAQGVYAGQEHWQVVAAYPWLGLLSSVTLALLVLAMSRLRLGNVPMLIGVILCAAIGGGMAWARAATLQGRLDFGESLNRAAGAERAPTGRYHRLAVLTGESSRPPSLPIYWRTTEGLDHSELGDRRIQEFVKRRGYRTSLARNAFLQLFESAALRLDRTAQMRVCLDNLMANPILATDQAGRMSPQPWQLIAEMLPDLPATSANRALLADLCDERRLDFTFRRRIPILLGDTWARFGDRKRAEKFYQFARLPPGVMESRLTRAATHAGRVRGKILWTGKPAANVQVGAISTLRWLELFRGQSSTPISLRSLCDGTITGKNGEFELGTLNGGEYYLVIIIPREIANPNMEVAATHQPGVLRIRAQEDLDVGTIEARPIAPRPAGQERST